MSAQTAFRFVQASNLLLDRFCAAGPDLPQPLQRLLIDAPFRAAERVFDAALRHQASFVLLAGGTFRGEAFSTWGCSFLARQCERLAAKKIPVYWAEAPRATPRWPSFIPRPANLHLADRAGGEDFHFTAEGAPPIRIRAGTFEQGTESRKGKRDTIHIGLSATEGIPLDVAAQPSMDYWAIQGGLASTVIESPAGVARTAGTPQGRTEGDGASGSCLLVEAGHDASIRTVPVPTAALTFRTERIAVDDSCNWEGFRRQLHARAAAAVERHPAASVWMRWSVQGHGPVIDRLLLPVEAAALELELNRMQPAAAPPAHSSIEVATDAVQAARWRTGRDDLAAFVRTIDRLTAESGSGIDLTQLAGKGAAALPEESRRVPAPHLNGKLKSAARRHAAQSLRPVVR